MDISDDVFDGEDFLREVDAAEAAAMRSRMSEIPVPEVPETHGSSTAPETPIIAARMHTTNKQQPSTAAAVVRTNKPDTTKRSTKLPEPSSRTPIDACSYIKGTSCCGTRPGVGEVVLSYRWAVESISVRDSATEVRQEETVGKVSNGELYRAVLVELKLSAVICMYCILRWYLSAATWRSKIRDYVASVCAQNMCVQRPLIISHTRSIELQSVFLNLFNADTYLAVGAV